MAQPRCIQLTAAQTEELQWVRDHHKKAYMRERAAAILKVASGLSMLQVALHGLLKPRRSDTISQWISRYEGGGVQGLQVQAGRGRKPAFSPCAGPTRSGVGRSFLDRNGASEPGVLWPLTQSLVA